MQIRFGTTTIASTRRVFLINICMHLLMMADLYLVYRFTICDRSNFQYELGNSTFSLRYIIICSPYNAECLCSFPLNRTRDSSDCYHGTYGRYGHIIIQVTFLTSVYLIRELFTLSGKFSRSFVYFIYTVCFLVVIGLSAGFFLNSCFHRILVIFLYFMCIIPGLMGIHDSLSRGICGVAPHRNIMSDTPMTRMERHEDRVRSWQELIWMNLHYLTLFVSEQMLAKPKVLQIRSDRNSLDIVGLFVLGWFAVYAHFLYLNCQINQIIVSCFLYLLKQRYRPQRILL